MKDPKFSATVERSDGLIIVTPEIQSWLSWPSEARNTRYESGGSTFIRPSGFAGVSAGAVWAGARVIEGAAASHARGSAWVTIFWEREFRKRGKKLFDEQGNLLDQSYVRRLEKFLNELIWMGARSSLRTEKTFPKLRRNNWAESHVENTR